MVPILHHEIYCSLSFPTYSCNHHTSNTSVSSVHRITNTSRYSYLYLLDASSRLPYVRITHTSASPIRPHHQHFYVSYLYLLDASSRLPYVPYVCLSTSPTLLDVLMSIFSILHRSSSRRLLSSLSYPFSIPIILTTTHESLDLEISSIWFTVQYY